MNAAVVLADIGNIGLVVCAVLTTASVIAYHVESRGQWRHSPFGLHLMAYMAALAVVFGQGAIYLATTGQVLAAAAPLLRPDWFAWMRVISFATLIPAVLAWRLYIILRPPGRKSRDAHPK